MEQDLDGTYVGYVALGETRLEYFRLKLGDVLDEESDYKSFYPGVKNADSEAQVFGPDAEAIDRRWVINGFLDEQPVGALYKVHFRYDKGKPKVWWAPVDSEEADGEILGASYQHKYFLRSRFVENSMFPLLPKQGADGLYEIDLTLPHQCKEEFVIVRDKDLKQVFCRDSESSSVAGPNDLQDIKRDSYFVVCGPQLSNVKVKLSFSNGFPTIHCESPSSVVTFRADHREALTL
jgi:hypothetical protein